ncbi:MAG: T9SS type A sorting domain-containing protein [Brumimicrobium sp.]|nr:T9SS type A sorting domain-containing protein [Brumimicrobium sp.]
MKTIKYNINKWLSKSCLAIFGLVATIGNTNAQSQNNVWSLAPNYFKNGQPFSFPNGFDYSGQPASNVHNAMQDANGNLLFFMVDDQVFDKDGYLIDYVYSNSVAVKGTAEIAFVPDPVNCQKYYIIAAGRQNYSVGFSNKIPYIATLDLAQPNNYYPSRFGVLEYTNSGTAMDIAAITPGFVVEGTKQGGVFIAASKIRNDNSRLVFISNGYGIYRYIIDNNGFNYDNYFLPWGPSQFNQISMRGEMELVELSNGNYRIAAPFIYEQFVYPSIVIKHAVFTADLDASGTLIPGTNNLLLFTYTNNDVFRPYIHGLEFSPDGNILYITHDNSSLHPNPIEYFDFNNTGSGVQPLNVTNALDFKSSQIELGKDGKLYLATSNRLATLSNPNNPNPANWTNNAQPISYTANYEGVSTPDYNLKTYILPDQIDGMDYTTHFFANTQCCLLNTFFDAEIFSATTNATWTPGTLSNPFGSVSGTVLIEKELIIPAGKTITIQNMTFKFAPGAKVVLQRGTGALQGGKLILNNTTFTVDNRCDPNAMWLGVQVYGYVNQNQTPYSTSQQGWFIMNNGSVVEHALKGAVAIKINSSPNYPYNFTSYDFNYTGGIIQATNSSFKNNRQDVEFRRYVAPNNLNNQSRFTNCEFTTNGLLNNPIYTPLYHVFMHDVVGIGFYGNDFKNLTPNLFNYWQQGWGIYSVDAHYFVNARCTSMSFPCSSFDPNEFQDLYFGIRALSSNALRTVKADRNKFINNFFGAYLGGPDFATFTRNDFEVYRSATPNQTFQTYGMYLNGCSGYKVEQNTFTEFNDVNVSANGNTYGVIVNNSGNLHNEIYKNQFHDIKIGGQAQGINGQNFVYGDPNASNQGLQFRCNTFYNDLFQADLAVTSGRIDYQQGYCLPHTNPMTVVSPAGNKFSHSLFDPQNDIAANNAVLAFNYAHHADLITTPLYYNFNVVTPQQCASNANPVYFDNVKSCPTKIKDGGIILYPMLKDQSDSLKQAITNKENLIDGGNTNYLLNVIATQNNGNVKNALLLASPYLSDEVLLAYLAKNPPAGHIQQVVLANSPVSQEVLNVLNSMNIPNGIKNQINNAQTGVSAMTYLNNEISFASTERNSLIDERIRLFLNDTLIQNPLDSIAIILKEEKREIRKKQLCDTYIGKGDTVKATETRDTLALEYGYNNYVKMADVQLEVFSLPSSCFAVITDPNIKQEVEYVAYDPNDRINAVRGEALLAVAFDSLFLANIEPLEPIGSGLRMGQNNLEQQKVSAKESSLSIYPNPSDGGIVNLEIKGDELLNNVSLEIYTITGQLVASYSFSGENRMVTINTNKLIPGVYFVKLFSNTQLIETKKLLINN